jgi:hypothetical protein
VILRSTPSSRVAFRKFLRSSFNYQFWYFSQIFRDCYNALIGDFGFDGSALLFSSFFTQEAKRLLSRTSPPDIGDFLTLDISDTSAMVVYSVLTVTSEDLVECYTGLAAKKVYGFHARKRVYTDETTDNG